MTKRDELLAVAERCEKVARIMRKANEADVNMSVWLSDVHAVQDAAAALRAQAEMEG